MAEKKPAISRKLLKLRKRAKNKKPEFLRSESWRYAKMSESWRRPRGLDHKMRRKIKGWPPMVSTGYKGPKIARGLHPSGLREVMVHNVEDLDQVGPAVQAARIAHAVGKRKRQLILAAAKEKKVRILNPGVPEEGEEAPEELAEGEEIAAEVEKPKGRSFGAGFRRRKPAEEDEPAEEEPVAEEKVEEETVKQPKRKRKTAKPAKTEEKAEDKEGAEEP
jgi:large subunit ribosomal protein L32e